MIVIKNHPDSSSVSPTGLGLELLKGPERDLKLGRSRDHFNGDIIRGRFSSSRTSLIGLIELQLAGEPF